MATAEGSEPRKTPRAYTIMAVVSAVAARWYLSSGTVKWRGPMRRATEACAELRTAKAELCGAERCSAPSDELQELTRETREIVEQFLLQHVELYEKDKDFSAAVISAGNSGDNVQKASEFFRTCYALDVIELRAAWGRFHGAVARSPRCLEASMRSNGMNQMGATCFVRMISDGLDDFQWSGQLSEMMQLYRVALKERDARGRAMLRWPNPMLRPYILMPDLRDQPVWRRGEAEAITRVMDLLEQNVEIFQQELHNLIDADRFSTAYEQLVGRGGWSRAGIYYGQWERDLCHFTPRTCSTLHQLFPDKRERVPGLMPNTEEVAFFHASPGSWVLPHNGGANSRVNIHIGLEGFEGSELRVHTAVNKTRTLTWSDKKAFAFGDGWIHEVRNGPSHRYVLSIGIVHPDVDPAKLANLMRQR